jgi:hypothetical protein
VVAYTETPGAWVIGGGPVCPKERVGEVSRAFVDAARLSGGRVVFFGVEERYLVAAAPLRGLRIGLQPFRDPRRELSPPPPASPPTFGRLHIFSLLADECAIKPLSTSQRAC